MKKFKSWINPFERSSASQLIILGIVFYVLGSLSAYLFNVRFDNFLHIAVVEQVELWQPFLDNLIILACLFVLLFVLGKSINSKTRGIDILSTALIGYAPFYLMSLSNINDYSSKATHELLSITESTAMNISTFSIIYLIILSIASILILVWIIALLYNGFKTAANAKGVKSIVLFVLALVATVIITLFTPLF